MNSVADAIVCLGDDGRVTYANRAASRFSRCAPQELLGCRFEDLIDSTMRDGSCTDEAACSILATVRRGPARGEALWRCNGSSFPVEYTAEPVGRAGGAPGAVVVFRDVTERARMDADRRASEARLAEAQELASFGSWEWRVCENKVTWSAQLYRMTGRSPEEFTPTYEGYLETVHPDDLKMVTSTVERAFADGGLFAFEHRSIRPDGTVRVHDSHGWALTNEAGQVVRMVGTAQDITERDVVDRMKREFIAVVSHEIRTPLASIRGSLGLLAGGALGMLPERGAGMVEVALRNAERLGRLVDDMLDLERIQSGALAMKPERLETRELIEAALEVVGAIAAETRVTFALPRPGVAVLADRDRIIQTLANLLGNAVKFSPAGGTIRVTAERTGAEVLLRVVDEGRGIPADELEAVFERFHQVDGSDSRRHSGAGLGLAICRTIVTQHGGRIWVESSVGEGSAFSLTLPAADD